MKIIFIFPHSELEVRNYWNSKFPFKCNDYLILINVVPKNPDRHSQIFKTVSEYLVFNSCDSFGILIHTTSDSLIRRTLTLFEKSETLCKKLAFVENYSSSDNIMTNMVEDSYELNDEKSRKPLDVLRSVFISNRENESAVNELESVWNPMEHERAEEIFESVKMNFIDQCIMKTPDELPDLLFAQYHDAFSQYRMAVPENFDPNNKAHVDALTAFRLKLN